MAMEEVKELVKNVDGWLTNREGELLYNLARQCTGKGVIVEIGSWKGKSTIWLAKGSQAGRNVRVYAVDPHTGSSEHKEEFGRVWTLDEFKRNIKNAGVDGLVTPVVKTSEDAVKDFAEPVELLFIDGAHEYELVKLDLDVWYPKVVDGGMLVFHDSFAAGPKRLLGERVFNSKTFRNAGLADNITFAQKVGENSLFDRMRNQYIRLLKDVCQFLVSLRLPKPVRAVLKKVLTMQVKLKRRI